MQKAQYIPVRIPELLAELRGQRLFEDVEPASTSGLSKQNQQAEKKVPTGFSFDKALSGIKSEKGLAVSSRGDGKLEGGSTLLQRGNVVQLAPGALDPENAEQTLAELDRLQAEAGKAQQAARMKAQQAKAQASNDSTDIAGVGRLMEGLLGTGAPPPKFKSVMEAASGLLADVGDDDMPARPLQSSQASAQQEQEPAYAIATVAADDSGPARIELQIELPALSSAADAMVDIGPQQLKLTAAGHYKLLVNFPCKVLDGESKAKWSKVKRRLTITLPQAS